MAPKRKILIRHLVLLLRFAKLCCVFYLCVCCVRCSVRYFFFFFQAEDGIRVHCVTGVQTCALPIFRMTRGRRFSAPLCCCTNRADRSEEHTSELQSHSDLVCRLLLEKKKKQNNRGYSKKKKKTQKTTIKEQKNS